MVRNSKLLFSLFEAEIRIIIKGEDCEEYRVESSTRNQKAVQSSPPYTLQISSAYCLMVRSEENFPAPATFIRHFLAKAI